MLLAERFAATTAFAHGLAFCQAVETIGGAKVRPRAKTLRVFLAELERLRQHAGAIQEICESTALVVATQPSRNFRGGIAAHLAVNSPAIAICSACSRWADCCAICRTTPAARRSKNRRDILAQLNKLEKQLRVSSSFLDRLEEVGVVSAATAKVYGLLGPVARASGTRPRFASRSPIRVTKKFKFDVPGEQEGDGYARFAILFAEARQSVRIMEQAVAGLPKGSVREPVQFRAGAAWVGRGAPRRGVSLGAAG